MHFFESMLGWQFVYEMVRIPCVAVGSQQQPAALVQRFWMGGECAFSWQGTVMIRLTEHCFVFSS
jgi:hypothetical protein